MWNNVTGDDDRLANRTVSKPLHQQLKSFPLHWQKPTNNKVPYFESISHSQLNICFYFMEIWTHSKAATILMHEEIDT